MSSVNKKARWIDSLEYVGKSGKKIWDDERRLGIWVVRDGLIYHLKVNNKIVK